jgi:2TM domain
MIMTEIPTTPEQSYQLAYRRARRQVKKMRGWYIHALVFTAVVGFAWLRFLFADSFVGWSGFYRVPRMPLGMTLGWGLALTIHGLVVFGKSASFGPFSQQWEDKQIERLVANEAPRDQGTGKW